MNARNPLFGLLMAALVFAGCAGPTDENLMAPAEKAVPEPVEEPVPGTNASALPIPAPIVFTGHAIAPDPLYDVNGECLFPLLARFQNVGNNVTGDWHPISITQWNWTYAVTPNGFATAWSGPDGYVAWGTSGTVPSNSDRVYVCSRAPRDQDYTLTLAHPSFVPSE